MRVDGPILPGAKTGQHALFERLGLYPRFDGVIVGVHVREDLRQLGLDDERDEEDEVTTRIHHSPGLF